MVMENNVNDIMTLQQVMELTGKTRQTIDLWTRQGLTKHNNYLHGLHFIKSEVMAFLTLERPIKPRGRTAIKQDKPAPSRLRSQPEVTGQAVARIVSHKDTDEKSAIYKGFIHKQGLFWVQLEVEGQTLEVRVKAEASNVGNRLKNAGLKPGQSLSVFLFKRQGKTAVRDFLAPGNLF